MPDNGDCSSMFVIFLRPVTHNNSGTPEKGLEATRIKPETPVTYSSTSHASIFYRLTTKEHPNKKAV